MPTLTDIQNTIDWQSGDETFGACLALLEFPLRSYTVDPGHGPAHTALNDALTTSWQLLRSPTPSTMETDVLNELVDPSAASFAFAAVDPVVGNSLQIESQLFHQSFVALAFMFFEDTMLARAEEQEFVPLTDLIQYALGTAGKSEQDLIDLLGGLTLETCLRTDVTNRISQLAL